MSAAAEQQPKGTVKLPEVESRPQMTIGRHLTPAELAAKVANATDSQLRDVMIAHITTFQSEASVLDWHSQVLTELFTICEQRGIILVEGWTHDVLTIKVPRLHDTTNQQSTAQRLETE